MVIINLKNNLRIEYILIIAILSITIIEITAILNGLNGGFFTTTIASITGITGYLLKRKEL